jgi:uncharacterized protein YcbK (DUF882 family)
MRKYIAPFLTYKEYQCQCCRRLPPLFYHDDGGRRDDIPTLYEDLFDKFELLREKWGRAIPIGKWGADGGYRCLKRQKSLYNQEISKAYLSVHNFGLALDMDLDSEKDVKRMVSLIKTHCPELRIGWKGYLYRGQTFVHIDMGYRIRPIYNKALYEGAEW